MALTAIFACLVTSAADWDHSTPVDPRPNRVIDESRVTYFVSLAGDDAADGRTRQTACLEGLRTNDPTGTMKKRVPARE